MEFNQLLELDLDVAATVEAILDGQFQVDSYHDNLELAEDYILEVEQRWPYEDTTKAWQFINQANVL